MKFFFFFDEFFQIMTKMYICNSLYINFFYLQTMTDIFGPLESTNGVKGVMVVNFYDDRITSTIFRDQSEAKDLFCKLREVHVLIN